MKVANVVDGVVGSTPEAAAKDPNPPVSAGGVFGKVEDLANQIYRQALAASSQLDRISRHLP